MFMDKVSFHTNFVIMKSDDVLDYTTNMHMLDQVDMQISKIECLWQTCKWYRKAFLYLLDVCIFMAFNLHHYNNQASFTTLPHISYSIIAQLQGKYGEQHRRRQATTFGHLLSSHLLNAEAFLKNQLQELPEAAFRRQEKGAAAQLLCMLAYHLCSIKYNLLFSYLHKMYLYCQ